MKIFISQKTIGIVCHNLLRSKAVWSINRPWCPSGFIHYFSQSKLIAEDPGSNPAQDDSTSYLSIVREAIMRHITIIINSRDCVWASDITKFKKIHSGATICINIWSDYWYQHLDLLSISSLSSTSLSWKTSIKSLTSNSGAFVHIISNNLTSIMQLVLISLVCK